MKAVAFLRAVNVGGTAMIAMAELKALAEDIGLAEPKTLLQSGNLMFEAGGKTAAAIEKLLEREIAQGHDRGGRGIAFGRGRGHALQARHGGERRPVDSPRLVGDFAPRPKRRRKRIERDLRQAD